MSISLREKNATQAYYVACPYCNGVGVVYVTDIYGNVLVDYYGNPQTTTCGNPPANIVQGGKNLLQKKKRF